ncbi:MAG TPA: MarR family winged helix-turn-helix transcriptional regulator [Steroidobacteraceae bacterium]|jgi:DNA-binding MarR family transcriptional regulator|nr:MarR family winged helix-turn-helix transcriptional regulator [Steroidobacteraceae bacterium]
MSAPRPQGNRGSRSGNGNGRGGERRRENGENNGRGSPRSVDLTPLAGSIGYTVRRAQMALFADFVTSLREVNLRPGQFGVLLVVQGNPGLSQSDVCAALGFQKANLVPLISGLEERGLLVRKAGVQDRRSYALHLTARGRALLRRAGELQAAQEARLTQQLGENGRATLLTLLGQILSETDNSAGGSFALET